MGIFKKKRDFIQMLCAQAEKTTEGMKALYDFIHNPTEETGEKVKKIEAEADEMRRFLINELNKSFITPIDREDIFSLSRIVDDIVDYAKSTVEEMSLFEVETNQYFQKIAEALYHASEDILAAMRNLKKHPSICSEHLMRAKKAENFVEHRYREGLVELFKNNDFKQILKTREIYRHLSNAADRADEAANIIGDILVKMT